jgi:hypothetical protein
MVWGKSWLDFLYIMYMSEWSNLVKKLCKQHPGKPLGAILVEAKKQYKKTKGQSMKVVKSRKNKSRKNKQ